MRDGDYEFVQTAIQKSGLDIATFFKQHGQLPPDRRWPNNEAMAYEKMADELRREQKAQANPSRPFSMPSAPARNQNFVISPERVLTQKDIERMPSLNRGNFLAQHPEYNDVYRYGGTPSPITAEHAASHHGVPDVRVPESKGTKR